MRRRVPTAPLVLVSAALLAAGCGGPKVSPSTTGTAPKKPEAGHAAPDLEALLPGQISGTKLSKGSTTGAVVFGSDAFSKTMAKFLRSVGRKPSDLRFANALDPRSVLEVETGVFEVRGLGAAKLLAAIVASTRPAAPGLKVSTATIAGRAVTKLVYPGSSVLYLRGSGDRVYYVGSQSESLASQVLAKYP
jgi:hypothetical protein